MRGAYELFGDVVPDAASPDEPPFELSAAFSDFSDFSDFSALSDFSDFPALSDLSD
jgi:hypothetical protein